jgi:UDP-N-acetylmuramoylalanine--D-glutamate ligase
LDYYGDLGVGGTGEFKDQVMALMTAKTYTSPMPRTLIVGLGKTGVSCARFLRARGVPVAITDSREHPPGLDLFRGVEDDLPIAVGGFDAAMFAQAEQLIVSPGVSLDEPLIAQARARGVEIIGDVELFARHVEAPVIAITGSNGKSTVTALVGEMAWDAGCEVRVGGNIGLPVLDLLATPVTDIKPELYVIELSSFQLETTHSLNAVASVVLNVSPDHMDRYGDLDHYAGAKQRIFHGDGAMVLNRDDPRVMAMGQKEATAKGADTRRKVATFGLGVPTDDHSYGRVMHQGELYLARGQEPLLAVTQLRLAGEHNQLNALAALALGEAAALPMEKMLDTLQRFTGLPHRMQWVAEIDGVQWINDSKGTNVGATVAAICGLSGNLILIAGGQGKGADFSPLREAVAEKVRTVILLGEDASTIDTALAGGVPVVHAQDMDDAVDLARAAAKTGDTVLLSPACASFDMFDGFAHRGQVFMRAVQGLMS